MGDTLSVWPEPHIGLPSHHKHHSLGGCQPVYTSEGGSQFNFVTSYTNGMQGHVNF